MVKSFLEKLKNNPESIEFSDTMEVIEQSYLFTETAFENGKQRNSAGQNSGSCKIFAFAQLNGLTQAETLQCFGSFYRKDVLQNPDGDDHQNIRQFMINGWDGIKFSAPALTAK